MANRVATISVHAGWCAGHEIKYLDLGPINATLGDAYVLITGTDDEGNPLPVEDQHVIFDCAPGEPHYSPMWLVHYAVVGKDYRPNSVRSEYEILSGGLPVVKSRLAVNCPLFMAAVRVQDDRMQPKSGWFEGARVFYFDFGQTTVRPSNVYQFAYCRLPGGLWNWVREQAPVFDAIPGDREYSALRRVNLVMTTASYRSNVIRDVESIYGHRLSVQPTAEIYNMPVIAGDAADVVARG